MPKSLSHIYLCIVQGHQNKIRWLRHQEIPPPYCCLFVLYGEGSPLRLVWQSSAWVLCYPNYSNLVKIIWEVSLDLLSLEGSILTFNDIRCSGYFSSNMHVWNRLWTACNPYEQTT